MVEIQRKCGDADNATLRSGSARPVHSRRPPGPVFLSAFLVLTQAVGELVPRQLAHPRPDIAQLGKLRNGQADRVRSNGRSDTHWPHLPLQIVTAQRTMLR